MSTRRNRRIVCTEHGGITAILLTLLVVVIAVGGAAYWFLVREDSAPKPEIAKTKIVEGGSVDGTWNLSANDSLGSYAQYRIHEQFASGLVDNEATGRTSDVTGSMAISGSTVSGISVTADLTKLQSDKAFRDNVLKSRGLETDKFPTATFTSTAPATLPSAPVKGETIDVPVTGELTLHGVKQPITATLQGRWDGEQIQVIGSIPIKLADYGMTAPTTAIVAEVDDHGTLELNLFFTKAS
jgi:polyisoprenoid-binding protein YceI